MKRRKSEEVPHIVCILDRSGSMSSSSREIIGSFNTFLDEQKAERGDAKITLVLFDDKYEVVYDGINVQDAKPIDSSIYYTRGMTGLYDAVGKAINTLQDSKGFVLIQTDGQENASREYNKEQVTKLIKDKEVLGWDFMFLGADINASDVGSQIGLGSKSVQYTKTSAGIETAYSAMSNATSLYRASLDQNILTPEGI